LTSIKAETTKNEEARDKYLEAKEFLDKLTPKEVLEQKRKELQEKIEEVKARWIEHEIANRDETSSAISSETMQRSGFNNLGLGAHKERRQLGLGTKKTVRVDLEKLFQEKLDKGDL